jgi:hypothetical protein
MQQGTAEVPHPITGKKEPFQAHSQPLIGTLPLGTTLLSRRSFKDNHAYKKKTIKI